MSCDGYSFVYVDLGAAYVRGYAWTIAGSGGFDAAGGKRKQKGEGHNRRAENNPLFHGKLTRNRYAFTFI